MATFISSEVNEFMTKAFYSIIHEWLTLFLRWRCYLNESAGSERCDICEIERGKKVKLCKKDEEKQKMKIIQEKKKSKNHINSCFLNNVCFGIMYMSKNLSILRHNMKKIIKGE